MYQYRNPVSRPQFGQIASVLAGYVGYLLRWNEEDKQVCGEEAMTLVAPLESTNNLEVYTYTMNICIGLNCYNHMCHDIVP